MRSNSLVCWFGSLYRELGLAGCSSHSGRRTFITRAARKIPEKRRNTGVIFEWLVDVLSLQGISDAVAVGYIEGHERISARSIERALRRKPSCPKLAAYHRFYDCG